MPATSRGELVKRAARIKPLYKSDQDFLGRGAQCDGQGGDENTAQQRPDVCTDGNTDRRARSRLCARSWSKSGAGTDSQSYARALGVL